MQTNDHLLDRLARFPERVAPLLMHTPPPQWQRRPPQGGFSLVEHLCHLRDLEREGFLVRIERIVAEDMPQLQEIDGTAVAEARRYREQDAATALRDWQAARGETVARLRLLLPAHAARTGIFGGFGVITLAALAEGIAAHDEQHWVELAELASSP